MTEQLDWQKSSFSTGQSECVEVAATGDEILIRESDDPDVIVKCSRGKLRSFVLGIKAGHFGYVE